MKNISKLTLILALGFSSVANAGFSNQYVASRLSYANMQYTDSITKAKSDDDLSALSIAYGFNLVPRLRLEAELNIHSINDNETKADYLNYGYYYYNDMSVSTATSMFNVYYDFVNSSRFTPFVMAGVGVSAISYDYEMTELTTEGRYRHIEDNDTKSHFAYQMGLGLAFKINHHFTADVMYKYANLGSFKFNWNLNKLEQREDLLSAGVRYTF